jgi:hyperosmotically inducible periplasmic protein
MRTNMHSKAACHTFKFYLMRVSILGLFCALPVMSHALGETRTTENDPAKKQAPSSNKEKAVSPDNSAVNKRDRAGETLTPIDQSNTEADRILVKNIRQEVMKQEGLSVGAQNVKIIVRDGMVTLRGPVDSALEKEKIASIANRHAPGKVDNQIEIKGEVSSREQNTKNGNKKPASS